VEASKLWINCCKLPWCSENSHCTLHDKLLCVGGIFCFGISGSSVFETISAFHGSWTDLLPIDVLVIMV
jgi:hypothetical protein